jgi:hypothetical protein
MNSSQRTFVLLAIVFAGPLLAAYLAYFFWKPATTANHGELLAAPLNVSAFVVRDTRGAELPLNSLSGKWTLLQVDSAACEERCRKKLYAMRQAHIAQGKNQERVQRVFLTDDGTMPGTGLLAQTADWLWYSAAGSSLLKSLPAKESTRDHIYIVDPLGNVIMRFSAEPDIKGLLKDLERLLKVSQIG